VSLQDVLADTPRLTRRQAVLLLLGVALFLGASTLAGWYLGDRLEFEPEPLREWLDDRGPAAPLVFMLLMTVSIVFAPVPSLPLDIAAGLAFGWFWGTVYVLVGAEAGAVIAFLIARRLGRPGLERWVGPRAVATLDRLSDRIGWRGLALMRLIPLFNFDWVSYAAGLTKMPLASFASATLVGTAIPVIGIVAVGDSLGTAPLRAAVIFGGLVLLAVVPLVWWAFRGGRRRGRAA
jgi:uncharacterized membrane protein YdjX (TVP38/TMEM64 family)